MEYKTCKAFPDYEVSVSGKVRNRCTKKILKTNLNSTGYLRVGIYNSVGTLKQVFVHRLVYKAYLGEVPKNLVIDHIDSNRKNPHKDNLQAISQSANCSKKNDKACPTLVDPLGVKVTTNLNIGDFCRTNNLPSNNFNQMVNGRRKSCLGWRVYEPYTKA